MCVAKRIRVKHEGTAQPWDIGLKPSDCVTSKAGVCGADSALEAALLSVKTLDRLIIELDEIVLITLACAHTPTTFTPPFPQRAKRRRTHIASQLISRALSKEAQLVLQRRSTILRSRPPTSCYVSGSCDGLSEQSTSCKLP